MTPCKQRRMLLELIHQACDSGARLHMACTLIGLHVRTIQRWQRPSGQVGDLRTSSKRRCIAPANKFSQTEREAALTLLNSHEFKDLPPSQIVPRLEQSHPDWQ